MHLQALRVVRNNLSDIPTRPDPSVDAVVSLLLLQGVKHCEARNNSIIEILGGVRAGDARFDVSEQFHFVFWMGE